MKLEKYFLKLKLKLNERLWRLRKALVNHFGVLDQALEILIYGPLLLLLVIANLVGMFLLVLSLAANVFTEQSAKGTFIRKNPSLEKLLKLHKLNTDEVWDKILRDGGSVQDVDGLDDITVGKHKVPVKEVFQTFKEINQLEIVNQAGIRQQYIDQSVSLNLSFPSTATPKFINKVHLEAWTKGIKTLYYVRTESVLRGDIADKATDENCLSCDG